MKMRTFVVLVTLAPLSAWAAAGDWRDLAERMWGAAALLADVDRDREATRLEDVAKSYHDAVRAGDEREARKRWPDLREAFERYRRRANTNDGRIRFLVDHFGEEVAKNERKVRDAGGNPSYGGGSDLPSSGSGILLLDRETCIGTKRSGPQPCSSGRQSLSFKIPKDVEAIRAFDAEWRDFGQRGIAQVYLNDRLVWESDVAKNWERDGRELDVRVPRGSTLTIASKTDEPIWVRTFGIQAARKGSRDFWDDWGDWDR